MLITNYTLELYVLGKRSDKRSMKLLRGSERDLKLDISRAQNYPPIETDEGIYEIPPVTPQHNLQVEGSKQFKSLSSRRVPCNRRLVRSVSGNFANIDIEIGECQPSRVEFHKTLCLLVRMGCGDKQIPDRNNRRAVSYDSINLFVDFLIIKYCSNHIIIQIWFKDPSTHILTV